METDFKQAVGKGAGEVLRDIEEFLSTPCIMHGRQEMDLCTLLPELNMIEQFSFALLSEARTQGWETEKAERFYRRALEPIADQATMEAMLAAFRAPDSDAFRTLRAKYGNRFSLLDGSYWSTCLALGIDASQIGDVMQYLRSFTVCLMGFAYMGECNPSTTYTWDYYESFRRILDELTAEPETPPLPLKVRALGGTAGKRTGDGYRLSLGLDIKNPNPDRMARDVEIDVTLKDRDGKVITVIRDRVKSIDPAAIFHYGVTRRVNGAATVGISATARATSHLKLSTPTMKHIRPSALRLSTQNGGLCLKGELRSDYDTPIAALTLHYQLLSEDNRILGGGNEWLLDGIAAGDTCPLTSSIGVPIERAVKAVYSVDFDAIELVSKS